MTTEAQTLLQYEPALQWLVDHPGSYPRAVARRHDLDVPEFLAWYNHNGPIASDARIRELKISAGLLTDGEAPERMPAVVAGPKPGAEPPEEPIAPAPKKQRYWSRRPKTPATTPPAPERRPWSTPEIRELKPETNPIRVKLIVEVEVRVRTTTE